MISSLLNELEEYLLPKSGWLRTCVLSVGVGTGVLFCLKYYLSSRRAVCGNNISLSGKTCIITGANTGIGKAVAFESAKRNARVILACRDVQKGNRAAVDIRKEFKHSDVNVYELDLASFESITNFVDNVIKNESAIDVLVNNAALFGCPFTQSVDGIEMQFAVNHLGHFLLTNLLLNKMKGREDSRIIMVSSSLYERATLDLMNYNKEEVYDSYSSYKQSKLANILFSNELTKRNIPGITINSMHPGIVWTELSRHRLTNGFLKVLFHCFAYFFLQSPEQGAQTIVYMATEPSLKYVSGKYFGQCKIEDLTDNAKDGKVAEQLWEISAQLTSKYLKRT